MRQALQVHLTAALLLSASALGAETWYFAANGDDTRSSTTAQNSSTPWKSISKLSELTLKAGDNLLFRRGDRFNGSITLNQSGTAVSPITIGAYGAGARPVLSGTVAVDGWSVYSGSIYQATISLADSLRVEQLFVNEAPLTLARHPNKGWFMVQNAINDSTIQGNEFILPGSVSWVGASIHIKTWPWWIDSRTVKSHDNVTGTITLDQKTGAPISTNFGYFINNSLSALDEAGEWYYDASAKRIYAWMPQGGSPSSLQVTASVLKNGLTLNSRRGFTIQDVSLFGYADNGITGTNDTDIVVKNCSVSFCDRSSISMSGYGNVSISNCSVRGSNEGGIIASATSGCVVTRDTIVGIAMKDRLGRRGLGQGCCLGNGLDIAGNGFSASYNLIDSIGYKGLTFGGTNGIIDKNVVIHFCMTMDDGGGIYSWSGDASAPGDSGTIVRNNIVMHGVGTLEGERNPARWAQGIYIDDRLHHITLTGNTVTDCENGILIHNDSYVSATSNTAFDNWVSQIKVAKDWYGGGGEITGNTVQNNILYCRNSSEIPISIDSSAPNVSILAVRNNNLIGRETMLSFDSYRDDVSLFSRAIDASRIPTVGAPLIRNGSFDSANTWSGWVSQLKLAIDTTKSADHRCLHVVMADGYSGGEPLIYANTFSIKKDTTYLLRFKAVAKTRGSIWFYVRRGGGDYSSLGLSATLTLDTVWKQYYYVFKGTADETAGRLDFTLAGSKDYWLDEIGFFAANSSYPINGPRGSLFVNTSDMPQTISLAGQKYFAMDGTPMGSSFDLQPFTSRICIADTGVMITREENGIRQLSNLSIARADGQSLIMITLSQSQPVRLRVYSLDGRLVGTVYSGELGPGQHRFDLGKSIGQRGSVLIAKLDTGSRTTAIRLIQAGR